MYVHTYAFLKVLLANLGFIGSAVHPLPKIIITGAALNVLYCNIMGAGKAQSVWRLATGWTVWGSSPGGGEIFRTRPDRPWSPPSLLYNGYRVFLGDKAAGTWR
jgi:hypothetical protein